MNIQYRYMQTGKNNPWDKFVDSAMQQTGPEDPGKEFTEKVLNSMKTQEALETVTAYTPPISKMTWGFIALMLMGMLTWASFSGVNLEWGWMSVLDRGIGIRDILAAIELPDPGITTGYSIGIFALFICIQILLMKRRLDRQIQLN